LPLCVTWSPYNPPFRNTTHVPTGAAR
jgi:hypothetical protein